jgi:hypothetical protein
MWCSLTRWLKNGQSSRRLFQIPGAAPRASEHHIQDVLDILRRHFSVSGRPDLDRNHASFRHGPYACASLCTCHALRQSPNSARGTRILLLSKRPRFRQSFAIEVFPSRSRPGKTQLLAKRNVSLQAWRHKRLPASHGFGSFRAKLTTRSEEASHSAATNRAKTNWSQYFQRRHSPHST